MNETEMKNQIKSMIERYLPILKANNNADNREESLFYSEDNTIVKIMTNPEMELFNAPIKFIIK